MLLTIATTRAPATDLGFLLHKHPGRVQSFDLPVGTAHVFYPHATGSRCTATLLLEVDPIGLVRGRNGGRGGEGFALQQYVNDRPYAASSMLAVALGRVFRTAMAGRCDARPELAAGTLPLEIRVPALSCRGGAAIARRLFEPLGWQVTADAVALDETFPEWGESTCVDLRLAGELRLADALNHLYVLLPVLDGAKHYWVSTEEVDKLVRAGSGWLSTHPDRELISRRYLAHRRELVRSAIARLAEVDDTEPEQLDNATEAARVTASPAASVEPAARPPLALPPDAALPDRASAAEVPSHVEVVSGDDGDEGERPVSLAQQRRGAVLAVLRAAGARRVGDLGCGEGTLLADLLADPQFVEVVGVDVSARSLEAAARRLRLDRSPEHRRERLRLFQSSLTYRDARLAGLDAAVLMEVVEHVDPPRLAALERAVFAEAAPGTVVVTTPNIEYNVRFEMLDAGRLRHRDHRFEWTRQEFREWAGRVASEHRYTVRYLPVGTDDPQVGPPTQLAVFTRAAAAESAAARVRPVDPSSDPIVREEDAR